MYAANQAGDKPLTILDLSEYKQSGKKISCLTAYDASFAGLIDAAGVDVILVGDSLGNVIQGGSSTIPVSVEDMVYHTHCVSQGRRRAFLISDLPFLSYATVELALESAMQLMQRGRAQMVKLEGGQYVVEIVEKLTQCGIPVCAHLGLLPQSIHKLGKYRVAGRDDSSAEKMLADARLLESAGADLLVLECVPQALAKTIAQSIRIPTIGIGAGPDCDGQVLVLYDMLGIVSGKRPRFVKNFMEGAASIEAAVREYVQAVRDGRFPAQEHSY